MKNKVLLFIESVAGYLENILSIMVSYLFILLLTINIIQIILRGFFTSSLLWILEASMFLGIWIVFLGASVIFLRDTEIKVTIIVDSFSIIIRRVIEISISIFGVIFAICLIWANINYQKYVGIVKPEYLPFSYRVHTFPIYVFAIAIIYNCLNIILNPNSEKHVGAF